jgi:hypothetical protein
VSGKNKEQDILRFLMATFLDDDTEDMVGDIITIEIDNTFAEIAKKI